MRGGENEVSLNGKKLSDILSSLNNKANADFSNVVYPQLIPDGEEHESSGYKTWMSTDGDSWYVKQPTGLILCGLVINIGSGGPLTINLPVTFSNTNYSISYTRSSYNTETSNRPYQADICAVNLTVSSFQTRGYNNPLRIMCIGY